MPTRLVEILTSEDKLDELSKRIVDCRPIEILKLTEQSGERISLRVLMDTGRVEELLDQLEPLAETGSDSDDDEEQYLGNRKGTRITVFTVDTTLPPLHQTEHDEDEDTNNAGADTEERLTRFELYDQMAEEARLTPYYLLMVALSSIVAAVGLIQDNVALIVGAMVIAPLLVPNVSLALGIVLADSRLALRASRTGMSGVIIIVAIGLLMGWWLPVSTDSYEIASRTQVDELHFMVAAAAGVAGALAISRGISGAMVGVMVAVALLPPLMVAALLAGSGYWLQAGGALILYIMNIAAINLAGIVVFLSRGITPSKRWQKKKAQKAAWIVIGFWLALTFLFVGGLIVYSDSGISAFGN